MIDFIVRVTASVYERKLVLDTLHRLLGPTRVQSGCVGCQLVQDVEDPNRIALIERWDDEASLVRHIRSRDFRLVLAVVDMSTDQPEVRFDWTTRHEGLDYIEKTLHALDSARLRV